MYALPSPGRKCDPDAAAEHSDIENAARPPYHRTSLAALRGQPSLSPVLSMYIPPEIRANLDEIERRAGYLWKFLDVPGKQAAIAKLEEQMGAQNFWDSQKAAQKVISECNGYKNIVAPQIAFRRQIEDAKTLAELITESPDGTADAEVEELRKLATDLLAAVSDLEIASFLSGLHDRSNAIVTVKAGAGGTESNDWADLLYRMYTRWAERKGFELQMLDLSEGEEAGIKGAVIEIKGQYAYGFLRPESGVHRLVRISPFDSQARRHTSFASVFVYPVVDEEINIEIRDEDLRIDVYRASGAGGQHVNKTSSAVRITHMPTGLVCASQAERSQFKNKATAMKQLKNKLYQRESDKLAAAKALLDADKQDVSFGSQIRSYVFQPYTMVNDHRTELKIADVQRIMDGGIDPFIQAYLKQESEEKAEGRPL